LVTRSIVSGDQIVEHVRARLAQEPTGHHVAVCQGEQTVIELSARASLDPAAESALATLALIFPKARYTIIVTRPAAPMEPEPVEPDALPVTAPPVPAPVVTPVPAATPPAPRPTVPEPLTPVQERLLDCAAALQTLWLNSDRDYEETIQYDGKRFVHVWNARWHGSTVTPLSDGEVVAQLRLDHTREHGTATDEEILAELERARPDIRPKPRA
jgi:hypothetical protein